jgi:hypothetical protein
VGDDLEEVLEEVAVGDAEEALGDLFEHFLQVMPMPARPRRRQRREPPDLFASAA